MSPEDFESYQKGYEDAMRAAGQVPPRSSTGKRRGPRGATHSIGEKIGEGIGYAFGWLVLFPVFMGLFGGTVGWFLGGDFSTWALFWGGLAFLFSLFVGVVAIGWRIFLATWPIVIGAVVVLVIVAKLFG